MSKKYIIEKVGIRSDSVFYSDIVWQIKEIDG